MEALRHALSFTTQPTAVDEAGGLLLVVAAWVDPPCPPQLVDVDAHSPQLADVDVQALTIWTAVLRTVTVVPCSVDGVTDGAVDGTAWLK